MSVAGFSDDPRIKCEIQVRINITIVEFPFINNLGNMQCSTFCTIVYNGNSCLIDYLESWDTRQGISRHTAEDQAVTGKFTTI